MPFVARAWVRWKVKKVREEFSDQLPPNLQVLTVGPARGLHLLGAFVAMVENANEPSKSEFSRAITDERLGIPARGSDPQGFGPDGEPRARAGRDAG